MKHGWALFHGKYRITKQPMTEYAAQNARIEWGKCFKNLEIREVRG
jgi:hypothetical protein